MTSGSVAEKKILWQAWEVRELCAKPGRTSYKLPPTPSRLRVVPGANPPWRHFQVDDIRSETEASESDDDLTSSKPKADGDYPANGVTLRKASHKWTIRDRNWLTPVFAAARFLPRGVCCLDRKFICFLCRRSVTNHYGMKSRFSLMTNHCSV